MSKLKLGDESAFTHIYTRWGKPLLKFIENIIGTRVDAECICQEAFVKLWVTRDSIDPDKNIKTYIFLIAKQLTLNLIRDRKRNKEFVPNLGINSYSHISTEIIAETTELELLTEYAISKLPPRMREIYSMYYFDNLSYEQIASLQDTNTNNIKAQIHKARTKLRKKILPVVIALLMSAP
ncbi:MAG: sigma-70 family RNA polymerase sigma factor [Rikenellaceae bacterium]|nr:sigma-70 family RNA polymerase sigma factor [Rikenellaceae bacterium]MCL2692674.1 sigma-70 family RNA polymerase sigma factor [Rikenellaceae bacterium]